MMCNATCVLFPMVTTVQFYTQATTLATREIKAKGITALV